jgi:Zn-finger nucleic acid-binding protein/ribosomal protein L40E
VTSDVPPRPGPEGAFDAPEAPVLRCPSCGAAALEGDRDCAHCGSLLSTRRCATCFALSPRDAEKCVRCGALLPTESLRPAPGRCPDCREQLVARQAGVAGFAECPRCGGLFLGNEAFDAVVKDAGTRQRARAADAPPSHAASPQPGVHYRPCPMCRKLMNRSNFGGGSGVIVDVCGAHGVFLDRGELTRIVDFIEKGGWERVRKREIARMEEDVAALESRKRVSAGESLPVMQTGERREGMLSQVADVLGWLFG